MDGIFRLTETDAIAAALVHAQKNGWPWVDPISCARAGGVFLGPVYHIRSNTSVLGNNASIEIDGSSGAILRAVFA